MLHDLPFSKSWLLKSADDYNIKIATNILIKFKARRRQDTVIES
jgi:hypothetical protein